MSAPKRLPVKGFGNVRGRPPHVEADPNGSRTQRRLWRKLYGAHQPVAQQQPEAQEDPTE